MLNIKVSPSFILLETLFTEIGTGIDISQGHLTFPLGIPPCLLHEEKNNIGITKSV
jgi:hypothetical protein